MTARARHHAITFEAAHLALGPNAAALADYFDACRRKRSVIDYDNSSVATETEATDPAQFTPFARMIYPVVTEADLNHIEGAPCRSLVVIFLQAVP